MRNALVHHKPNKPPKDDITPPLIADFLIAVAEPACRLVAADKRQDIRPMLITRMPTTSVRGAQVHEGLAPARRRGRPSA